MKRLFPILCYHRVHADDDPATPDVLPGECCCHVNTSLFTRQMRMLLEAGFQAVTHGQIMSWLLDGGSLPEGPVALIDFDDNRLNVFENAFPVMRECGFKGTVFVVSALAEGNLPHMQTYPAMNWEHLSVLMDSGWTIGAHTKSHFPLAKLFGAHGAAAVENEMAACAETIRRRLGINPPNFAYPQGDWSEDVERIVKRYCRTARHWSPGGNIACNTIGTNPYRLQAVNISMHTTDDQFRSILAGARDVPQASLSCGGNNCSLGGASMIAL